MGSSIAGPGFITSGAPVGKSPAPKAGTAESQDETPSAAEQIKSARAAREADGKKRTR